MTLATAIMPTADRHDYVPCAIASFLSQDYPEKELLILDNGRQSVEHLVPDHPQIRYERLSGPKRNVAQMRNLACSRAAGEVILHWDDDDWSAPDRMSESIERLKRSGAMLVGYHTILFVDEATQRAWRYEGERYSGIVGTSFCYWRNLWQVRPFPSNVSCGEDLHFRNGAGPIDSVSGAEKIVARIHNANTSPKWDKLHMKPWVPIDWAEVERIGFPVEVLA